MKESALSGMAKCRILHPHEWRKKTNVASRSACSELYLAY